MCVVIVTPATVARSLFWRKRIHEFELHRLDHQNAMVAFDQIQLKYVSTLGPMVRIAFEKIQLLLYLFISPVTVFFFQA